MPFTPPAHTEVFKVTTGMDTLSHLTQDACHEPY